MIDAGRRGGATVVCDLPRQLTPAVEIATDAADLVVLVTTADVRACAATAAVATALGAINPNVGLVVRGPSPGGLRSVDVARIVGLPLLAAMRPQPGLAEAMERGGLRMRHRSPLATAARRVLSVLAQHPSADGGMSVSLIDRVRERLAAESAPLRPNVVAAAIRAESGGVLGDTEVLSNLRMLQTELTGVGILEPLLRAEGTTDVLVTAPDAVWVDDGNGLRRSSIRFADEAAVRRLAQRLALSVGRRLDEAQPWVDGQLTGVAAGRVHGPAARRACADRLRRNLPVVARAATGHPGSRHADAVRARSPQEAAALLDGIIAARLALLVSGGTGAGKTTLLGRRPWGGVAEERIVCVEDAAELDPRHPHLVKLVARSANVEGVGEITVRDLVRQALRMRPDRIVVGEVRGAEVVDLLAALNTGHDGGAGTVHANNPAEVPARLEALAALGGLDRAALHSQLAAAVQVLLHVGRDPNGKRRLSEIAVLRRDANGIVGVASAWNADTGFGSGAERSEEPAAGAGSAVTSAALALALAVVGTAAAAIGWNREPTRRRGPMIVIAVAVAAAMVLTLPATAMLAAAILVGTLVLRRRRASARRARAAEASALQGALDVLIGELRVGVHPVAAFEVAAREIDGPVAENLRAVAARARLGADVAAGLRSIAASSRLPSHWQRLALFWRLAQIHGLRDRDADARCPSRHR